MVSGSWFRICGVGVWVSSLVNGVWGLESRDSKVGSRVQVSGCGAQILRFGMGGLEFKVYGWGLGVTLVSIPPSRLASSKLPTVQYLRQGSGRQSFRVQGFRVQGLRVCVLGFRFTVHSSIFKT